MDWKTLVSILLLCAVLRASAIKVSYQSDRTPSQYDLIRRFKSQFVGKDAKDLKPQAVFLPHGSSDRVFIDWTLQIKNQLDLGSLNVTKECARQLGQFSSNLNNALFNFTSPLDLFDEKNWSLKGKQLIHIGYAQSFLSLNLGIV